MPYVFPVSLPAASMQWGEGGHPLPPTARIYPLPYPDTSLRQPVLLLLPPQLTANFFSLIASIMVAKGGRFLHTLKGGERECLIGLCSLTLLSRFSSPLSMYCPQHNGWYGIVGNRTGNHSLLGIRDQVHRTTTSPATTLSLFFWCRGVPAPALSLRVFDIHEKNRILRLE